MVTLGVRQGTWSGLLHYPPPVHRRWILALLAGSVVVDITYWTIWFAHRSWLASDASRSYTDFENAFPLADAWLGLSAVLALICLVRRSPQALLWLLATGSAAAYLLGMDVLYDLEHRVWWTSGAEGWIELGVNVATAVVAATFLTWSWRNREALQSPGESR
ncbi:MAG: hypothetical protein JWN31_1918 [Frankiales bacterium]|nr:hypothetical protein [Frankiales bacterium]